MAASVKRNMEYIQKNFDVHYDFIINKLNESNISLAGKSMDWVSNLIWPVVNYIDFVNNNSTNGLETLSINDITKLYYDWCNIEKQKFPQSNYKELHDIILDYKTNGVGYYWVNINNYYDAEMLFRMNNCARVKSSQNLLELREYTLDGFNYSRVVVVIDNIGIITQIQGINDCKPNSIYNEFIYNLFLNYKEINGFNFYYKKESNFTQSDLTSTQLSNLINTRPEVFCKLNKLI